MLWCNASACQFTNAHMLFLPPQLGVYEELDRWLADFLPPEYTAGTRNLHTAFLRFYRAGEKGDSFDPHHDGSNYTIIINLDSWGFNPGKRGAA